MGETTMAADDVRAAVLEEAGVLFTLLGRLSTGYPTAS